MLRVWKDKEGLNATYGRLLDKFLQGKNGKGAQKICEIVSEVALPPYGKHSSEKQGMLFSDKFKRAYYGHGAGWLISRLIIKLFINRTRR